MLIQFSVKNFKSIKEEATLDLSATKMTELTKHIVSLGNDRILKSAVIYGANASGKSNIIDAFKFMSIYILNSFAYGDESKPNENENQRLKLTVTPFLFSDQSANAPSTFEVFFIDNEDLKTYQYGFELNQSQVFREWMYRKAKTSKDYRTIFEREGGHVKCNVQLLKKFEDNLNMSLEKETLVLSLGAKLKINIFKKVRDWFSNNEIVDYGNPIENLWRNGMLPKHFSDSAEVRSDVVNYFASFDKSIKGFDVKEIKEENGEKRFHIDTKHYIEGGEKIVSIPLNQESGGTLKMFSIYPVIKSVLEHGSILLADELNARLHPLLVRNIALTFMNEKINKNHAQLIFTSHDTWLLSTNLFRRDEIWFVEKNQDGESTLFSLAEFENENGEKIRKDENYEKNYLLGKYGAIPSLKEIKFSKSRDAQ